MFNKTTKILILLIINFMINSLLNNKRITTSRIVSNIN